MRTRRVDRRAFLLGATVSVLIHAACGSTPSTPSATVASGMWGGDHIAMTVAADGVHLELDCAHADTAAPILVDSHDRFSVAGTFTQEHGGPIRVGEPADSRPAILSGTAVLRVITLSIHVPDLARDLGPFQLTFGSSGRVVKCL